MEYVLYLIGLIGIYAIVCISLDLLVGYAGILAMSQGAIFGVGAYLAAILNLKAGWDFLPILIVAILIGLLINVFITAPAIRISGDFFVVASFAMQILLYNIYKNWSSVTGGLNGMSGQAMTLFGIRITSDIEFLVVIAIMLLLTLWICLKMVRSPFGRVLKAMGEDEIAVQSLGKNVVSYKIVTAAVSGALAAMAGVLYSFYIRAIDPSNFDVHQSVLFLTMLIFGGAGHIWGALIGVAFLTLLPEALKFLPLGSTVVFSIQQLLYGIMLVLFMMFLPGGIINIKRMFRKNQS